jgi:hypothetical protein
MSYTKKEQMHFALTKMLEVVRKSIGHDLAQQKNIGLCLDAYNLWREDERDGQGYIFNLDNADDLKYLVCNDMLSASEIALIMSGESHFFIYEGDADAKIEIISLDKVIEMLVNNAEDYMAYAIMYVGRGGVDSPYSNIYEEYVTSMIEDYFC